VPSQASQTAVVSASDAAAFAQGCIGWKFQHHGRQPRAVDCYGLVLLFAESVGVHLPDYDYDFDWEEGDGSLLILKAHENASEIQPEKAKAGDIVVFRSVNGAVNHMGIMVNRRQFVHAHMAHGVLLSVLDNPLYQRKAAGFYRLTRT